MLNTVTKMTIYVFGITLASIDYFGLKPQKVSLKSTLFELVFVRHKKNNRNRWSVQVYMYMQIHSFFVVVFFFFQNIT